MWQLVTPRAGAQQPGAVAVAGQPVPVAGAVGALPGARIKGKSSKFRRQIVADQRYLFKFFLQKRGFDCYA